MLEIIDSLQGEYRFLSNFYASPMFFGGRTWPTCEHAFQAMKSTNYVEQEQIRAAATPGTARQLGRSIALRAGWEAHKVGIMLRCLRAKFENRELAEKLMETSPAALMHGNDHNDRFWGVVGADGQNMLGILLMQLRDELIDKELA